MQIRISRARAEIRGLILALRALKRLVTKIQKVFYDAAMRHRRHAEIIEEKRAAARLAASRAESAPIEEVHLRKWQRSVVRRSEALTQTRV
jgi:hypothetical protein